MSTYTRRASLEGLEMEIFKLVSKRATPEQWAEWLRVPLEHAAVEGNLDLADKLLGAGANGSAGWRGCGGRTLLHAAAVGGNEGVVSSLLRAGAQPDVNLLPSAPPRLSPLYLAADAGHEAAARILVMAGADVNLKDTEEGFTVLHAAILGGHERLAEELIMWGADISARTPSGSTPLHEAVLKGLEGVVSSLLLKGVDKDAVNNHGHSALIWACGGIEGICPKLALVETLLAAGVDVNLRGPGGRTALYLASKGGCVSIIHALVRHRADVNCYLSRHFSALHAAAVYDQADAVDALVEAGADIEVKTSLGRTPLCSAAEKGKAKSLLAFLRQGASVGAKDNKGETPIHLACVFQPGGLEGVADLLLRWGADETAVDQNGRTPGDFLDKVHESRTCSQDEVERVRLLLGRAPADRAWRRRGWLVMLRARASRARNESSDISSGTGTEGSNAAGGGAGDGRKMTRREGATRVGSGEQGQASRGEGGVAAEGGVGNEVLRGAVCWLVEMEPASVFQTILAFL